MPMSLSPTNHIKRVFKQEGSVLRCAAIRKIFCVSMPLNLKALYPFLNDHPQAFEKLSHMWKQGTSFLGVPLGILGGAMTWVSTPDLVAAMAEAGSFGVLASGAMTPEMLSEKIAETKLKTKQPFGVNVIVMHPQLQELLQVCQQHAVSHVVFAGGMPTAAHLAFVKDYGGKTLVFTPSAIVLKRLKRQGADAFIIEGAEAGGHIGPVSTSVLAQEILPLHPLNQDVQKEGDEPPEAPIFIAGGIGHGAMVVNYLRLGAAGCQMGTRFVCAKESPAHPDFKKAFIRASARDATVSVQLDARLPVIPVRALKNKGMSQFIDKQKEVVARVEQNKVSLAEGQLEIEHFWAGALRRAVCEGDIEHGSLMAGQSVGLVKAEEPVQDIIAHLLKDMLAVV